MTQAILAQAAAQNSALPDKKYFKIGEASSLLSVKPHVLRYWESEFPQIKPYKSRTGQRLYRRRDVEALQHIQRLLYQERYTIAGARQALRMMYENESPILEEVLTEDAIEAAVAIDLPLPVVAQVAAPAPAVLAPALTPVLTEPVACDVLEVVEMKLAQSQMADCLKNARRNLREMLETLSA